MLRAQMRMNVNRKIRVMSPQRVLTQKAHSLVNVIQASNTIMQPGNVTVRFDTIALYHSNSCKDCELLLFIVGKKLADF